MYQVVFSLLHHLIFDHWMRSYQDQPEYFILKSQLLKDIFADLNRPRYNFLQRQLLQILQMR